MRREKTTTLTIESIYSIVYNASVDAVIITWVTITIQCQIVRLWKDQDFVLRLPVTDVYVPISYRSCVKVSILIIIIMHTSCIIVGVLINRMSFEQHWIRRHKYRKKLSSKSYNIKCNLRQLMHQWVLSNRSEVYQHSCKIIWGTSRKHRFILTEGHRVWMNE